MLPATHPQLPFAQAKTHINACPVHATYFTPKNKIKQPQLYQKPTLPTSNTTTNGSFSNLITQTSANENTIVQAPLMFVQGGGVDPGYSLTRAGNVGYYWSSVGRSSSRAYYLYFGPSGVLPSIDYGRYYGLSVRCVALGG